VLERALAELPEESREVLLLRDVEGLTGQEAAGVLGLSLAAMKSRLHRGRLELKERVEASLGLAPGKGLS
jgi:RNA polymerase sigma-70 factor (ECF subfamily)